VRILNDLEKRRSLEFKLRHWPHIVFGTAIDAGAPEAVAFDVLKARRNRLMHFTSSHETFSIPGIVLQGLADTSAFST
jgi:hypothetical protein